MQMELIYMCNFKVCTFILIENYNGHLNFLVTFFIFVYM